MNEKISTLTKTLCILSLCLGLIGCTSTQENSANVAYNEASYKKVEAYASTEIRDPFETINRGIFGFNNVVDLAIIEPTARFYVFITPRPVRKSVQNFMRNLRSPMIVANNLLQGDFGGAGIGVARFVINSTAGIVGIFDVAEHHQGLMYEEEDFGQTLAVWGVGDGFYIVLPILGPSSLRDTVGIFADSYYDPVRIWSFNDANNEWIYYTRGAIEGLDKRARLIDVIQDLRANSLDYYAAVRSIYSQKRKTLIQDGHIDNLANYNSIPDYDDDDDF